MQCRPTLQAVLLRGLVVAHLFAAVDQTLLHGWDALLLFHALFYLGDLLNYNQQTARWNERKRSDTL
jgi:ABC-type uncharacterized transport system permease subunit